MKRLGLTQRVDFIEAYDERRDSLDQRWSAFTLQMGLIPVPLPNIAAKDVSMLLEMLQLDAVLLTGGNSVAELDPSAPDSAPERDAFEIKLIDEAMDRSLPVFGVCRGMQIINLHLGGQLSPITDHAGCRHQVTVEAAYSNLISTSVNSYHKWAIKSSELAPCLIPIARDKQGYIEGFTHENKAIAGIMWHPERETQFKRQDIHLIKKFLL